MLARILIAFISLHGIAVAEGGPVSFRNDVMAAISKAGCNLGTCHGNATGKGGFKLSLRGQDIDLDYAALALDMEGRRVNGFDPENSLLLLKGTNKLAHEGGKRMDPKGWEFAVMRDWIAAGTPRPNKNDARLTKLDVTPREATLESDVSTVQIKVTATFSDGSIRDVTQRAVYEPLQVGLVDVTHEGLVKRLQFGEPSVLVRYLDQSVPVRLMFVKEPAGFVWAEPQHGNFIDAEVFHKLNQLHMNPSGLCSDQVFMRRAYLDLLGLPPTADEARSFVADQHPDKRSRLMDSLLSRPEFVDFWSMKWADVLKVESRTLDEKGMNAFHAWIRDAVRQNRPVNEFVSDIIASRGSTYQSAPSNFYRANRSPVDRSVSVAQVFLGTRLQCAQCHNHPFDQWTQDDYYSWAATFARVDYKLLSDKRSDKNDKHEFIGEQVVFLKPKADLENPRTGDDAKPRFLGADMPALNKDRDELQAAAQWLTSPQNTMFAAAQANRIWYHLMGRGLVDPVDDFRLTNPASHPKLLEELAADFVASGFDQKHLIRTIMLSCTYQLDSTPNETNAEDAINYSRNVPRRLSAEQLFDSLHQALGVAAEWKDLPRGTRASQKPGPINGKAGRTVSASSSEAFLGQFGKPPRQLSCECERTSSTSLSQAFLLISGPMIHELITDRSNALSQLARHQEAGVVVDEIYWRILNRAPTAPESLRMTALLIKSKDKRATLEDIAWSLVNAKEFVLRQ